MDHLLENRLFLGGIGIAVALALFVPSIVGHLRRARSIRTVAAFNALACLTSACILASLSFVWVTAAIWLIALVLALISPATSPKAPGSEAKKI